MELEAANEAALQEKHQAGLRLQEKLVVERALLGELEDWLSSHMLSTGCLGVRLVYSQYSKSGILIRGGLRHQPALTHITSHQHTGTASYTRHNLTLHNTITNNTITNNTISNSKNNIT